VYAVDFIVRIYQDARSAERQIQKLKIRPCAKASPLPIMWLYVVKYIF